MSVPAVVRSLALPGFHVGSNRVIVARKVGNDSSVAIDRYPSFAEAMFHANMQRGEGIRVTIDPDYIEIHADVKAFVRRRMSVNGSEFTETLTPIP